MTASCEAERSSHNQALQQTQDNHTRCSSSGAQWSTAHCHSSQSSLRPQRGRHSCNYITTSSHTSPHPSTPSTTPTPSPCPPQATDRDRDEVRSCSHHRLTQPSPVRCPSDRSWRPVRWQRSRALDLSSPAGQRSTTPPGGSRGDNTNTLSLHIHKIKAENGT